MPTVSPLTLHAFVGTEDSNEGEIHCFLLHESLDAEIHFEIPVPFFSWLPDAILSTGKQVKCERSIPYPYSLVWSGLAVVLKEDGPRLHYVTHRRRWQPL